jgi:hypothetical protein
MRYCNDCEATGRLVKAKLRSGYAQELPAQRAAAEMRLALSEPEGSGDVVELLGLPFECVSCDGFGYAWDLQEGDRMQTPRQLPESSVKVWEIEGPPEWREEQRKRLGMPSEGW